MGSQRMSVWQASLCAVCTLTMVLGSLPTKALAEALDLNASEPALRLCLAFSRCDSHLLSFLFSLYLNDITAVMASAEMAKGV